MTQVADRRVSISARFSAPSRRIRHAPGVVDLGDVDDGRRAAGQRAAVDRQVRGLDDARIEGGELRRRRLARAVRARLEEDDTRPGERAADQAHPEPLGILAAGERVAALRVGDHEGHRAGQERPGNGARPLAHHPDQLAHDQRREVHDRRRLAVVAPLDLVDPGDRGGRERVAGEPVEPVGREDGDAAGMDAALERRACGRRPVALDRDDLAHLSRRSRPGRCRPGRRGSRPGRARPPRPAAATSAACPSPTSSAIAPAERPACAGPEPGANAASRPRIGSSPSSPPSSASRGSCFVSSGSRVVQSASRT